jgi:spermidine/putrescine transport system substrate-binding protein
MNFSIVNFVKYFIRLVFIIFWLGLIWLFLKQPNLRNSSYNNQSINIYTWPDFLQHEQLIEFEKKTGIKVNLNYYENNNEIFTKLNLSTGAGIDLVMMTDEIVKKSIENNLLQKIDHARLNFWHDVRPDFQNLPFDPKGLYSIPYSWDIYGVGYSKKFFQDRQLIKSWQLLFDPTIAHVAMINEPFEIISIASQYLNQGNVEITENSLTSIKKLLMAQKQFVEAYTDMRVDYLLTSGTSPVGVTQSAYFKRAMEESDDIGFFIPKEGSFLVVDSVVIPKSAQNLDAIYKLLNYINSHQVLLGLTQNYGYLSARNSVLQKSDLAYLGDSIENILAPTNFKKFGFFYQNIAQSIINNFWIDLKA